MEVGATMVRRSVSIAISAALFATLLLPLPASAASVTVSRPALSKTTGITTATKLKASGFASPVPVKVRSTSATLVLSKRTSKGTYTNVRSVKCTLSRRSLRVNYAATLPALSKGAYRAKVRFVWVTSDRKTHSAISPFRTFTVAALPTTRTWSVAEQNFAFSPPTLTVHVGDKVVFTNKDLATTHHVRIDGKLLPAQVTGVSVTWVAPRVGTFPYLCVIHTFMTGQVTVK